MAERNDVNQPDQNAPSDAAAGGQERAREGHSERAGEGGYGNDTGFATGTQAPRDDADPRHAEGGGTSAREQQTSDTYRDAGQGQDAP